LGHLLNNYYSFIKRDSRLLRLLVVTAIQIY